MIENFTCNFAYKINNLILNEPSQSHVIARRNQNHYNSKKRIPNLKIWVVPNMTDDIENMNTRRLFQGRKISARKFPFIASVHVNNEFVCGGSIIARCVVITAATCLENDHDLSSKPQHVFIRVGSDFANRGGKKYQVVAVHIHPEYDPTNLVNNLAILKLDCDMENDEKQTKMTKIRRVEYDTLPEQIPINVDEVTALGWGAKHIDDDNFISERLSFSHLNMYHIKDCQSLYTEKYVTLKNFCAGFISKGGGACNRDVGGPGILDGLLMGVISFGSPVCGIPDAPTVFTKLGYYTKWIESILEEDQLLDDDEDVEKANQILALIQTYYKEDRKDLNKRVPTERTQINDNTDEDDEDTNIINTVVQLTSHIEVPNFIKDLYRSLPTKLINLFAKNLDQDLGISNDDIQTKERAKTNVESKENLDLIFLPDTTDIPKKYQKLSKMRINQSQGNVKTTKKPNSFGKKESHQDVSRNYESDSDINYNIEIGMSIANK
ncbi:PREDICTED: proclotting enzyme-like [Papilio xuthus]|uniref:Proclotting enzyme-like n=1 Tax=Papilio xuthus TaxID=66420 RepID=A0AAJ6Z6U1_PAPXU|nr:PREDICTED: proclotting enzyme-like [Papilio xuthus]